MSEDTILNLIKRRELRGKKIGDQWQVPAAEVERFERIDGTESGQPAGVAHEQYKMMPAVKFMRENFNRHPSLTEIARTVNYSPFHFHREFRRIMGLTTKRFMVNLQIDRAKNGLLAGKQFPQIVKESGFVQHSHFSVRFRRMTGLTPTEWRSVMRLKLEKARIPDR